MAHLSLDDKDERLYYSRSPSPLPTSALFSVFGSPHRQGDAVLPPYSPPKRRKISGIRFTWTKSIIYTLGAVVVFSLLAYVSSQKSEQIRSIAEHIREKQCGFRPGSQNVITEDTTQQAQEVEPPVQKVIKVTFDYGKGSIDSEGHNSAMNDLRQRVIQTHIDHASRHNHRQVVQRTDLIGNIFTKVATILHIMIDELNKPEGKRSEWIV
jgi:hypothetical protein